MTDELIGEAIGSCLIAGIMFLLAWSQWRGKRTGEKIRQVSLLVGFGLGYGLGAILVITLGLAMARLGGPPPKGLTFLVGTVVGLGGYAFGRVVEKRYDRRRVMEEDDYLDPPA